MSCNPQFVLLFGSGRKVSFPCLAVGSLDWIQRCRQTKPSHFNLNQHSKLCLEYFPLPKAFLTIKISSSCQVASFLFLFSTSKPLTLRFSPIGRLLLGKSEVTEGCSWKSLGGPLQISVEIAPDDHTAEAQVNNQIL